MKNPVVDEKKDEDGDTSSRVNRGGSWTNKPYGVRVEQRYGSSPTLRDINLGFRIVRNTPNNKM